MRNFYFLLLATLLITDSAYAQNIGKMSPVSWNKDSATFQGGSIDRLYSHYKNYVDVDGFWKESYTLPRASVDNFFVKQAPYELVAPLKANLPIAFTSKNKFDPKTKSMFDEAPLTKFKQFTNAMDVEGELQGNYIVYPNAVREADLVLVPDSDSVAYLLRWDSKPSMCNEYMEIEIDQYSVQESQPVYPRKKNKSLVTKVIDDLKNFEFSTSDKRKVFTKDTFIWDSNGKSLPVDFYGSMQGDLLKSVKRIPCDFFEEAVFPVYTDDTDSIFSGTNDGVVYIGGSYTWSNAVNATTGDGSNYASATYSINRKCGSACGGSFNTQLRRPFFEFDLSSYTETYTVSSASLNFVTKSLTDVENEKMILVEGSQSSPLVNGDFDAVGSVNFGELDLTAFNADDSTYETLTMSGSGLSYIDTVMGSTAKLAMRYSYDFTTTQPSSEPVFTIYFADEAGTSKDPYLEITYTIDEGGGGGGGSGSGSSLSGAILTIANMNCVTYASGSGSTCTSYDVDISTEFISWYRYFQGYIMISGITFLFVLCLISFIMYALISAIWKLFALRK